MKTFVYAATAILIFAITGCNKEKAGGPWNIKIEDGAEAYNYTGVTYPAADGMSATFQSSASFGSNGNGDNYNTRSQFSINLGNVTRIDFMLILNTADSAIVAALKPSNSNTIRFNAFQKVVKKGVYSFNDLANAPFIFYTDKKDSIWVTDLSQISSLEVVSTAPNTQDNTANAIITQINFDLALKGINFPGTKRIKGSMFSFFNLN